MIKGIIGRKVGMTQIFEPKWDRRRRDGGAGGAVPRHRGPHPGAQRLYRRAVGFEELRDRDERKLNEPEKGYLRKSKLPLLRYLREVEADDVASVSVGDRVDVTMFAPGDLVDVIGRLERQRLCRRGQAPPLRGWPQDPRPERPPPARRLHRRGHHAGSRLKGMRMAGHMGNERVTVQNLRVLSVDTERNLLIFRGAVPGPTNGLIMVRKAIKNNGK